MATKYTKYPQNIPNGQKYTKWPKKYQMAKKIPNGQKNTK
jgi:hypothetical protein